MRCHHFSGHQPIQFRLKPFQHNAVAAMSNDFPDFDISEAAQCISVAGRFQKIDGKIGDELLATESRVGLCDGRLIFRTFIPQGRFDTSPVVTATRETFERRSAVCAFRQMFGQPFFLLLGQPVSQRLLQEFGVTFYVMMMA